MFFFSFLILNNYEIPRENLLNKLGEVTHDGQYITPFKDTNKRHGAALGTLSNGRVMITAMCEAYCTKALTIALRYAAIRQQFGPTENSEVSLLEYQTHVTLQLTIKKYIIIVLFCSNIDYFLILLLLTFSEFFLHG